MKWNPIEDLPPEAKEWVGDEYLRARTAWHEALGSITDPATERQALDLWTTERHRLLAIETGQIEQLYTMRPGITEILITEGLENARSSHTVERALDDDTLRGLLTDQHDAMELVFATVKGERPLSQSTIKEWHALLTRHQELAHGREIGIAFLKGAYKRRPNNPRLPDGTVHEYCPPEHTTVEMERLLSWHHEHEQTRTFPAPVEAAWLHHRFVQIHPFEDGNGRTARLLMSYVFARAGEPAPVIAAATKARYFRTLESADRGELRPFATMIERLAQDVLEDATHAITTAIERTARYHHPNGDVTVQDPQSGLLGTRQTPLVDVPVPPPEDRPLRLERGTALPSGGPVTDEIDTVFAEHRDKIPAMLIGPGTKVVFGLSTEEGDVTPLFVVEPGRENEFGMWMNERKRLWGTPFGVGETGPAAAASTYRSAYLEYEQQRTR